MKLEFPFESSASFWFFYNFSILHSTRVSIMINSSLVGYFACCRGVRQEDPLSPLFIEVA